MRPVRFPALAVVTTVLLAPLLQACAGPPQITTISPGRQAGNVRTNLPIRISFDRPVDQQSVASRFRLQPAISGRVAWESRQDLVFEHPPLRPDTGYTAQLLSGYRDAGGHEQSLTHSWRFHTEAAPVLVSSSPTPGEADVDPAALVTLTFSREMDPASLTSAISIRPGISPALRLDPADARRVLLAPRQLLRSGQGYTVTVTSDARDVDGNQLAHGVAISFTSGPAQPLRHRLTFIAASPGQATSDGVWMVDEARFPRPLSAGAADAYAWSPDSSRILIRGASGIWVEQSVAGPSAALALEARWAAFLAAGQGVAYLTGNDLWQHPAQGEDLRLAGGVTTAAVTASGSRLAYVVEQGGTSQVWVYDVGLRSRYRVQGEAGAVHSLAWAPDGSSIAYLVESAGTAGRQLRVRPLSGSAAAVTMATGSVEAPVWQSDSRHVLFAAAVTTSNGGSLHKAFRLAVTDPPPSRLTLAMGLPSGESLAVIDPRPSPDGHQIGFLADREGGRQVFVMNSDGTGLSQLTGYDPVAFPYSCSDLAWTPA